MKYFFQISILQKYLMGITGLGLALFVLFHMLGNLLIFWGEKTYNLYSYQLQNLKFLWVAEGGLLLLFVLHIVLALVLTLKNRLAKNCLAGGRDYFYPSQGVKATPWRQKSLIAQGAVILVFVIWHLVSFKFGVHYEVTYGEKTVSDLYRLVVEAFQNPMTVIGYIFALLILSLHLLHGVSASFQSLGFHHPRFSIWINGMSVTYAILVTLGYVSLPIYVFFFKGVME